MTEPCTPQGVEVARGAAEWAGAIARGRFVSFRGSHPAVGAKDVIERSVAQVNATFNHSDSANGDVVVEVGERIFIRVTGVGPSSERKRWLHDLAEALTQAGLEGKIVKPSRRFPPEQTLQALQSARPVTSFLAFRLRDDKNERVQAVMDLFGAGAHTAHVAANQAGFELPFGPAVSKFIVDLHDSPAGIALVGDGALAHVLWDGPCTQLAGYRIAPGTWEEHVAAAVRFIINRSDDLTYAMLRRARHHVTWSSIQTDAPHPPSRRQATFWENDLDILPNRVTDVNGVQLLTRERLEAASDLNGWDVTTIGKDRFLVVARDLAAWFAGPQVDRDTLVQARRDFGKLIATAEEIGAAWAARTKN